jgi:putative ABC transport system ATP-binding protein
MSDKNLKILDCVDVSKTYHGAHTVNAVKGVNVAFESGKIYTIMGKSGSGKSTLLNLIGALDLPSSGNIFFMEKSLIKMSDNDRAKYRNEQVGFIYQNYMLLSYLSAIENVMIPMFKAKLSKSERRLRAENLIERMGLSDRKEHYPRELSGGEQQRIAIARALCNEPQIIIADEPTANVDKENEILIMNEFVNIKNSGKLVIIATHNEEYREISDRVLMIKEGIIGEGL